MPRWTGSERPRPFFFALTDYRFAVPFSDSDLARSLVALCESPSAS